MPELPEVETTRMGVLPHLRNETVSEVVVHNAAMRWPIDDNVYNMIGARVDDVKRRAKYILIKFADSTLVLHLGMSGSLRICQPSIPLKKHDHFVLKLKNGTELRLHDPRRFGAVILCQGDPMNHPLIRHLGQEPLANDFDADYLHQTCKNRKTTIKQHIMNGKVVVGVGNIYACEALFRSGIHPKRQAGRISKIRLTTLVHEIKAVLDEAITQGGTTLRDFLNENGEPGYFKQSLSVYDRQNEPCRTCKSAIRRIVISNRSTFFCQVCQK
ncbi:MAG: bifunctional DNA-formamidopyrimidine glycosylase/DNA-(apurinic or apyrimidinic site) lyase [Akkermansiaceae bacterium]